MKPTVEAYTVALPWYEREDFSRLLELAEDRGEFSPSYDDWHRSAVAVMNAWLARGKALQIVTVRPEPFVRWLADRDLPNTAPNRLRFVEELALGKHESPAYAALKTSADTREIGRAAQERGS
ncbi:hypothetical protein QO058_04450 [Bosea vestrisii]|uniref:hypothetical protein n=1 Tax=Bosea vestrisii TaxID=151416 RepID=UPI0024DF5924|nr:hypothetical protein [Bosea vestrisii]WID97523.1 hypothetical protein QO058_04450 [Bosea vestrisii]